MSARRLLLGEHGDIGYREHAGKVTASLYYRNHQGRRRRIEATGSSKTAARREALASLDRALATGGVGDYSLRTTFAIVAEDWYRHIEGLVESGRRSPTTLVLYRRILDLHVVPGIGGLRLSELTVATIDRFLQEKRRGTGYATAKACRSVASGVCAFAVRRDAMRSNPVRDVSPLEMGNEAKEPRALTANECKEWVAILDADEYAKRKDLPDLVRFLLGTGCRLGEALGTRWEDVDLERHLLRVERTVIRVEGQGLLAKEPKTRSGTRALRLPLWLVQMLRERKGRLGEEGPVFPDQLGGYRDRNNVERDFRMVRDGTRFDWVVPHTYRKTVATMLDQVGLSARTIADQLGHSRISMTQDVYLGRRAVDQAAATALQELILESGPDEHPPGLQSVAG
jgi:integrase